MSIAGDIDEPGFIRGLFRKGFTPEKCLSELLQNVYDAGASNCQFKITAQSIIIIDDGIGMDESKLGKMFSMFHENHKNDISMGVSGVGAKPSTAILSSSDGNINTASTVIIYTHSENNKYFKAIVPWDDIGKQSKYIGMIQISEMSHSEIEGFCDERPFHKTGTSIIFKYNETLQNIIESQFNDEESKKLKPDDRWAFIFGKGEMNISYEYNELFYPKLQMYNYFKDDRPHYYTGVDIQFIHYFKDSNNNDRFLWQENSSSDYYEFPKFGKGFSTDLTKISPSDKTRIRNWTQCGFFEVKIGMRKNNYLFNEDDISKTLTPFDVQHSSLCEYDELFMTYYNGNKDVIKSQLSKIPIIRNGQVVTRIDIDGNKASSARANAENSIRIIDLRCEISYNTTSSQENPMDICMGIQENKNQHSKIIPLPLSRLLAELKMRKFCKIKDYFTKKINEYRQSLVVHDDDVQVPVLVPVPVPVPSVPVPALVPVPSVPVPPIDPVINYSSEEDETSSLSDIDEQSSTSEYVTGDEILQLLLEVSEKIVDTDRYNDKYIELCKILQTINTF